MPILAGLRGVYGASDPHLPDNASDFMLHKLHVRYGVKYYFYRGDAVVFVVYYG